MYFFQNPENVEKVAFLIELTVKRAQLKLLLVSNDHERLRDF